MSLPHVLTKKPKTIKSIDAIYHITLPSPQIYLQAPISPTLPLEFQNPRGPQVNMQKYHVHTMICIKYNLISTSISTQTCICTPL